MRYVSCLLFQSQLSVAKSGQEACLRTPFPSLASHRIIYTYIDGRRECLGADSLRVSRVWRYLDHERLLPHNVSPRFVISTVLTSPSYIYYQTIYALYVVLRRPLEKFISRAGPLSDRHFKWIKAIARVVFQASSSVFCSRDPCDR